MAFHPQTTDRPGARPGGTALTEDRCRRFMADLERRDLQALANWFAEDAELWIPPRGPVRGPRRITALFRAIFRRYPEIHWRVTAIHAIESQDLCIYFSDSWGRIDIGTPYTNKVATILAFDPDGRITTLSDYFKDTSVFAAPEPCRCRDTQSN